MPLFTKNGSIPCEQTDGTEGWISAPDKPSCPDGKEVTWLNWEWVVRDPKPEDRPGYQWNWDHGQKTWIEYVFPSTAEVPQVLVTETLQALATEEIQALTTEQIQALSTTQVSSLTTEQLGGLGQ
jgi:hypothetical protein